MSINEDTICVSYFQSNKIQWIANVANKTKLVSGTISEIKNDSVFIIQNTGPVVKILVSEIRAIIIDNPNTDRASNPLTQNASSSVMSSARDLPMLSKDQVNELCAAGHREFCSTSPSAPVLDYQNPNHSLSYAILAASGPFSTTQGIPAPKQTTHSPSLPTPLTWKVHSITVRQEAMEFLPTTRIIHPPAGISPTDWNRKFNNDSSISMNNSHPQPSSNETILTITVHATKTTETLKIPVTFSLIEYTPSETQENQNK